MSPVDEHQTSPQREDPELHETAGAAADADIGQPPNRPSGESPRLGSDLITEAEAYATYSNLLEDKDLRRARQSGALGYLRRKRSILYRRADIEDFVRGIIEESFVPPCKPPLDRPSLHPQIPSRSSTVAPTTTSTQRVVDVLSRLSAKGALPRR